MPSISTKKTTQFLLLLLPCLLFWYCKNEFHPVQEETLEYLNLAPDAKYIGMGTCKSCHSNIHETFIHTGMGRSFDHATLEKTDATFGNHALVYDEKSDFYYFPYFKDSMMYVQEFRLNGKDTIYNRIEKISYIVGSGQHTNSHIVDFDGYVFQAPITFYTQEKKWDMAPGFEGNNERFDRLLASECLTCHNHLPKFEPQSMNKYLEMPVGIECERCHGPGEIHVREKLAGNIVDTSKYIDYSIVNPRDLSRDLQMDLCQRCHLQGVAVLQNDKTFYDFKPGMKLSEVMNVFLPRYTNSHEKFIMASQADRLRQSPCYLESEMTCITCHNPHRSIEVTKREQYNRACINCHQTEEKTPSLASVSCTALPEGRLSENDDCSHCHMPKSGSIDIPHVNITDHYISKNNIRGQVKTVAKNNEPAAFLGLKILTKDKGTPLEMAEGYIALYDKYVQSSMMLDSASYYLKQSPLPFAKKFKATVHYLFAKENYNEIIENALQFPIENIKDGWTAYRIGQAYYAAADFERALQYYLKSVNYLPLHLDFQEKLGTTYFNLKEISKAKKVFEFVLSENRKRPVSLSNLGYINVLNGKIPEGIKLYDAALALDPDYENALLNKASVLIFQKKIDEGKMLLERVLKINPDNMQVKNALEQL